MNAENIAELLMKLSPVKYACDWDNVGCMSVIKITKSIPYL